MNPAYETYRARQRVVHDLNTQGPDLDRNFSLAASAPDGAGITVWTAGRLKARTVYGRQSHIITVGISFSGPVTIGLDVLTSDAADAVVAQFSSYGPTRSP